MSASVLLLIDFQKAFEEIALSVPRNNPDAEKNAARLLGHWRQRSWPIVHVAHDSRESGSLFRPGMPGNAFMDFAQPRGNEPVIRKSVNSAFIGTGLVSRLEALGRPRIVIAGITTDHCVSTTARMAGNLGFDAVLAADAIFTFDRAASDGRTIPAEDVHRVNLASLADEFAAVTTADAILRDSPLRPVSRTRRF